MPPWARLPVVVTALVLAACTGTGGVGLPSPVVDPTDPPDVPSATPATSPRELPQMCGLVPLPDVQRILAPALARQRDAEPPRMQPGVAAGTCSYDFPGFPRVGALIDATLHDTTENAKTAYAAIRNQVGAEAQELSGFGDEAFIHGPMHRTGIKLRRGELVMQVNVRVDEADFGFISPLTRELT